MQLTIRYPINEFRVKLRLTIANSLLQAPKELHMLIYKYVDTTSFLIDSNLVHDYCRMSTEILCSVNDHKDTYDGCDCSRGREWQVDHYLLSRFKSKQFKQWVQDSRWNNVVDVVPWSGKKFFDWNAFGKFLISTLNHAKLIHSSTFLYYTRSNDSKEQILSLYNNVNSFLDVLHIMKSGELYVSAVHYTPLASDWLIELDSIPFNSMIPMCPIECLNNQQTLNCCIDKNQNKQSEINWIYCDKCQGGPFCSQECMMQLSCCNHFCGLECDP